MDSQAGTSHPLTVLTVPMRNGNGEVDNLQTRLASSSYRTYEEWKPVRTLSYRDLALLVLTVPMRNGN